MFLIEGFDMFEWIIENKTWLFSGALISIPIALFSIFISKNPYNRKVTQSQTAGDNSKSYQAARDINIGEQKDD